MAGKVTTTINDNEYIGDSLVTINSNFENLDTFCQNISSTFIESGSAGVMKITAGSNISISPVGGVGEVTINSTGGTDTEVRALTSNWQDTHTTVQQSSSNWNAAYLTVSALSATWSAGGTNLAAVTNYLSTNNVLISSATVTNILSANIAYIDNFTAQSTTFIATTTALNLSGDLTVLSPYSILSGSTNLTNIFAFKNDVLPTVTNYLSTNSVRISSATISDTLSANRLLVTNLTALSSVLNVVDITVYELSGFSVTGAVSIDGAVTVNSNISASGRYLNSMRYVPVSANFSALADASYLVNTTSGVISATLPTTPLTGDTIQFSDPFSTWDNNLFVINRNGNNIQSLAENLFCDVADTRFTLTFVGSSVGWKIYQ